MSKPLGKSGERYISVYSGYFNVQKVLDGKSVCFARFKELCDAVEYRDKCIANNWDLSLRLIKPHRPLSGMKYIQKVIGGYQVSKVIDGCKTHFGYFKTREEAMEHRDYCVEHNWSSDCIHKLCERHRLPRYITYNKGSYVVQKHLGNGRMFNMRFNNVEDAVRERDLLMSVDWDEERLIELDEAYGSNYDGGFNEHLLSER